MNFDNEALRNVAYIISQEKFAFKVDGAWKLPATATKEGVEHFLTLQKVDFETIKKFLKTKTYNIAHDADMIPNAPPVVTIGSQRILNIWQPPTLQPKPGTYPRIEQVLNRLCNDDEKAVEWVVNWIANKVQNPAIVPKVAISLATVPGGGKGTFVRVIEEMLGRPNCATIQRQSLESRFNTMWAGKLLVFADECVSNDNLIDVSQKLKIFIDSGNIELEGKHKNQTQGINRAAWIFASNDKTTPIAVEKEDRRYTILSNHNVLPDEYRKMLISCFEADKVTLTPSFADEVAAFYYDMLSLPVDLALISKPYENDARRDLIEANKPSHEVFIAEVQENGVDSYIDPLFVEDYKLQKERNTWDFGAQGVSSLVVYKAYVHYCDQIGGKPLKLNKFITAAKNSHWQAFRATTTDGKRVNCLVVPRARPTT